MKNKKVLLSVLSTAVVTSMISPAFAATKTLDAGLYIGGKVDKYYGVEALVSQINTIINEDLENADLSQVIYVDTDGYAMLLSDVAAGEENPYHDITDEFIASLDENGDGDSLYAPIDKDGHAGTPIDLGDGTTPSGDLKVDSVSTINKAGVTVTFPALTEAIEKATVEVKNNGVVVPVKEKLLDAGETTATFEFVTPLTADPAGTWTVDGKSFDANAQAAYLAVNAATDQVKLLAALKSSYFTGVVDASIANYWGTMDPKTYTSVKEVQDDIDVVNNAATAGQAVKAVKDATNEVQLLAALQNTNFKRVNADFIHDYAILDAVGAPIVVDYTEVATVTDVQTIIDTVNTAKATSAVAAAEAALTDAGVVTAQTLVTALPDLDPNTVKTGLQTRIDKVKAVIKVDQATTKASLLAALKAPALGLTDVRDDIAGFYKTIVDGAVLAYNYDFQNNVIVAGLAAAETDAAAKISLVSSNTTTSELKTLLVNLKNVSTTFDSTVNDALLDDYKAAILTVAPATSKDQPAEIKAIIDGVNNPSAALTALATHASNTTADAVLAKLKTKTLNLTNVVDANKDAYFTDVAALETAAAGTVADVQKVVKAVNALVSLNAATTSATAKTAVTDFALNTAGPNAADFVDLTSAAKGEVADLIVAEIKENGALADLADLETEIGTQITAQAALVAAVNNACDTTPTIAEVKAALSALAYAPFDSLASDKQLDVAEAFMAAYPKDATTGNPVADYFKSISAIKVAIDAAIAQ